MLTWLSGQTLVSDSDCGWTGTDAVAWKGNCGYSDLGWTGTDSVVWKDTRGLLRFYDQRYWSVSL